MGCDHSQLPPRPPPPPRSPNPISTLHFTKDEHGCIRMSEHEVDFTFDHACQLSLLMLDDIVLKGDLCRVVRLVTDVRDLPAPVCVEPLLKRTRACIIPLLKNWIETTLARIAQPAHGASKNTAQFGHVYGQHKRFAKSIRHAILTHSKSDPAALAWLYDKDIDRSCTDFSWTRTIYRTQALADQAWIMEQRAKLYKQPVPKRAHYPFQHAVLKSKARTKE